MIGEIVEGVINEIILDAIIRPTINWFYNLPRKPFFAVGLTLIDFIIYKFLLLSTYPDVHDMNVVIISIIVISAIFGFISYVIEGYKFYLRGFLGWFILMMSVYTIILLVLTQTGTIH